MLAIKPYFKPKRKKNPHPRLGRVNICKSKEQKHATTQPKQIGCDIIVNLPTLYNIPVIFFKQILDKSEALYCTVDKYVRMYKRDINWCFNVEYKVIDKHY